MQVRSAPIRRQGVRAQRGDTGGDLSLEEVMAEHGDAVLRLAYSYVRDRGMAEDIFQEAFLRWLRHRDSIKDATRLRGWLLTVTANLGRDHLRSWAHHHVTSSASFPDVVDSLNPEDVTVASDDARRLVSAVMGLPPEFREVVHLFYYEQLSTGEVAAVTGLPATTVRTRLFRARRRLAQTLTGGERE